MLSVAFLIRGLGPPILQDLRSIDIFDAGMFRIPVEGRKARKWRSGFYAFVLHNLPFIDICGTSMS